MQRGGNREAMNIVEVARANENFGTLLGLVEANGLTKTLGETNILRFFSFQEMHFLSFVIDIFRGNTRFDGVCPDEQSFRSTSCQCSRWNRC
jgi:hypothetical protein